MNARIALVLCVSSTLAALAGCGGGGDAAAAAGDIVSVYPDVIDMVSDHAFETLFVRVEVSGEPEPNVCAASSSPADVSVEALYRGYHLSEVRFEPAAELGIGEHVGSVEVFLSSDPGCGRRDGPSRLIPYKLVKLYGFTAEPLAFTLRVGPETTIDALRGSARIDVTGGPPQQWAGRSLTPWLVLDAASGLTGSDIAFRVDPSSVGTLFASGRVEHGEIEISANTVGMTSLRLGVTLQPDLPFANVAMPTDQPAGPVRRFRVRGVRFTDEALGNGLLAVEGAPGATFTRLGDTDLRVELPAALPAGSYRFVTRNALGLSPSAAVLRLTAPADTARALLPGNGAGGRMLWDGTRNALLVLEPPASAVGGPSTILRRHALSDGAWTTTSHAVDRVRRMAVSPDGAHLLGLSDSGQLHVYDPVRIRVVADVPASTPTPEPPATAPLAVTVDGQVWSGTTNAVNAYQLAPYGMRAFWPSTWGWSDARTARTMASRDGGRLLVSREVGAFVFADVAEGVSNDSFEVNAAGATTFDGMSDDGGRVLSGTNVYDAGFAPLGTLPAPGILSGDGRRAFTLESRSDAVLGGPAPVVRVFDLTAPAAPGGALPELGTVDLLDHATCAPGERACAPTSSLAVTPDGRVLFAQTAGGVVVVPIPESLAAP